MRTVLFSILLSVNFNKFKYQRSGKFAQLFKTGSPGSGVSRQTVMDCSCRTFRQTCAAVSTFVMVDNRQCTVHGDSSIFTDLKAFTAADTAYRTVFSGLGTWPFILALNRKSVFVFGNYADKIFGTGRDTSSAGRAIFGVYSDDTILKINSVKLANLMAVTETKTAI
jgi:hypothetical protein